MSDGITLAEELFGEIDVRERRAEEKLYRRIDVIFEEYCGIDRVTWDWHDRSVEIYLDTRQLPSTPFDLQPLWDGGFSLVWVHPFQCTKDTVWGTDRWSQMVADVPVRDLEEAVIIATRPELKVTLLEELAARTYYRT